MLVNVGESQITQSLQMRDLGVTFEQILNFYDHITGKHAFFYFNIINLPLKTCLFQMPK